MPNLNVTERQVKIDWLRGLSAGAASGLFAIVLFALAGPSVLYAIAATYAPFLVNGRTVPYGADDGAVSPRLAADSLSLFDRDPLIGMAVVFLLFVMLGLIFAAVWPRMRKRSRILSVFFYFLAGFLLFFLAVPAIAGQTFSWPAGLFASLAAAVIFIRRFRHA